MAKTWALLLSCEHGGATVPAPYRAYLEPEDLALLKTHRGWDQGALTVAQAMQRDLDCPLYFATVSRLLVDLNRSAHHRSCLGPAFRKLTPELKSKILAASYWPYRQEVEAAISKLIRQHGAVLHIAVHSFTPVLHGEIRTADIGLLYDPARSSEKRWAASLHAAISTLMPDLRVRRNYPYQGKADGFTRYLRQVFSVSRYAGFELEINQNLLGTLIEQKRLGQNFSKTLRPLL